MLNPVKYSKLVELERQPGGRRKWSRYENCKAASFKNGAQGKIMEAGAQKGLVKRVRANNSDRLKKLFTSQCETAKKIQKPGKTGKKGVFERRRGKRTATGKAQQKTEREDPLQYAPVEGETAKQKKKAFMGRSRHLGTPPGPGEDVAGKKERRGSCLMRDRPKKTLEKTDSQ